MSQHGGRLGILSVKSTCATPLIGINYANIAIRPASADFFVANDMDIRSNFPADVSLLIKL